jgi:hypothetical protein
MLGQSPSMEDTCKWKKLAQPMVAPEGNDLSSSRQGGLGRPPQVLNYPIMDGPIDQAERMAELPPQCDCFVDRLQRLVPKA